MGIDKRETKKTKNETKIENYSRVIVTFNYNIITVK